MADHNNTTSGGTFRSALEASVALKQSMLEDASLLKLADTMAGACVDALRQGGKILFCGNGGSAADAQHLAAELSGRYGFDRPPLAAEALHVNSSYMTAVANDYSFDEVYARMVKAVGRKGDVLIAISTSGNSPNIIRALSAGREAGLRCFGFSGRTGGKMAAHCEATLCVPHDCTPRIQEVHILFGHVLCEIIENSLFSPQS